MTTGEYIRETAEWETITYTRDQLANTFDEIERGALLDAADRLWDSVRKDVEAYWEWLDMFENMLDPKLDAERKRYTKVLEFKLDGYKSAFNVLGCELHIKYGWCKETIYEVTLVHDSCVRGCIRNN